ncbi:MAG TPA: response regulator, partial [Thermoanaerobaculia bacterium]|nr:response regulator [Thermoanaerobaculia bacterium]
DFGDEMPASNARHRHLTKLGEKLAMRIVWQQLNEHILLMAIDETEQAATEARLQHSEAHLRSLVEQSVDIIYQTNARGYFTFVNAAAARILGFEAEDTIRHHFTELIRPDWRERVAEHYRGQVKSGLDSTYLEFPCVAKDGNEVWIGQHVRTVTENGAVIGFEAIARDVSDRVALEIALADRRDAALTAARQKSEFLANISHEIRTPMNGVIGMLGILLDSNLDNDQRDMAETAHSSAESLLHLINDILDFSKMEAEKLQLETSEFELRDTIESVVELLGANARKKSLEIGCAIDSDVPHALTGDGGRLRQILLNLVGNAIKFTDSGGVVVRVSRVGYDDPNAQLLFRVIDTGIGMSAETCNSIFQPFIQADASTTRRFGGTGLGLAISKRLVAMMHGEIGVDSEPGHGSTFWFTASFGVHEASADAETAEPIRALIVDDSVAGRNLLSLQLSAWNVPNDVAADSITAIAMLGKAAAEGNPYDVVVSDLNMPQIDGLTFARIVDAQPQFGKPRFIVVSGTTPSSDVAATLPNNGVSVWLTKPIKERQLQAALLGKPVAPRTRPERAQVRTRKSGHILIAEDNAVNQMVTLRQVKKLGCSADAVSTGREALAAIARTKYDLVLMDCHMPEMDGFEAAMAIRQNDPAHRLPIIALTASVRQEDRDHCTAAGMDDFLAKPVNEADLLKVLERWLPETSLDQELTENLRKVAGDDEQFLKELMTIFVKFADSLMGPMESDAPESFGRLAHTLGGSSRNLGATRLAELCSAAEVDAYADPAASKARYLSAIRSTYAEVRRDLIARMQVPN